MPPFRTSVLQGREHISNSVGGKIGTTNRVIITDGGDSCCFDWRFGVGVVFPIVKPEGGTDGTSR